TNVRFGIAMYTTFGGLILHCQSDVAGAEFRRLPSEGWVSCTIQRFPIPAGRYSLSVFASVGGEVADWVQRACDVTVAEGDFYGSGRRPSEGHQAVLVEQEWRASDAMGASPPG